MKIAILGSGALGCTFGAALTEAGHETWLLGRSAAHTEAMRQNGLQVEDANGTRRVAVHATNQPAEAGPADLVVVLVKSMQTEAAMRSALALVGRDTLVMSLQNGLGHEEILGQIVGRERVLAGKTYVGGVLLGPGRVLSGIKGKPTLIGELDGQITPRVQRIADAFNGAGLATTISHNIIGTMWDKLLINVATGALSAITRLTYGQLYEEPLLKATALAAVTEAMEVAHAMGIRLSITQPEQAWAMASEGLPYSFKASMLQSLEKGSVTEVDFVNGSVVRHGESAGVATPVNATLVACMKGVERAMKDQQGASQ